MCDTLLCIHVFTFMHRTIFYVIVISMWYVTCVLSTLNYLYVISLVLCSFALLPRSTPMQMSFITCTHAYFISFWVHYVGLGHISLPNSFVLIVKSLYDPSMLKTLTLLHTRGSIIINHQKRESWVLVINDNAWLLWLTCALQRQLS